ncbi:MAG: hypothetical protein CMH22_04435 [Methylophaga sp.]|uniref:hypothetical protein n=1 Tax=Methylophaga sp. UBA678 TaxID=1946901 RepID=UPI000C4466C6|nr:hypothetical protein [Methylophaga sp. UBA678]MAX51203.1 hypothetical protein [Methylophaga sp.]|tara:strand:+ start:13240 stop:13479 length:240 start_codon:yes stop_codon:yes gene_type:complete
MSVLLISALFMKYQDTPQFFMLIGVDALIMIAFYFIIKTVYSAENKHRYIEESFIPLDDDSYEEKLRLGTRHTFSSRRK